MNLKQFQVRLDEANLLPDQETINSFMEKVKVKKASTQFVIGQPDFWSVLVFYENGKASKSSTKESDKQSVEPDVILTPEEEDIVIALKQWRKDKASALNVPNFMICHNAELLSLAKMKPRTFEELGKIKGFGDQKVARHGDEIISVINAF